MDEDSFMKKIFCVFMLLPTLTMSQELDLNVPELIIPTDLSRWKDQREQIRDRIIHVLGDLPARPRTPHVRTVAREDKGSYYLETFEFDNLAGAIVPGYFLIPKINTAKHPAIYYCHWHGGNYDLGKEEIFTTHHTPEKPAEALIAAGYAVLVIDAFCFGARSGKGPGGPDEKGSSEEMSASKCQLWRGRSLWGMMIRDDLMALDYLFSRAEIDTSRVAVTGISMGATRTWWLMALDERIKTGVAVGCLTRYQELIGEQKLKYHGIYYFVPGILKHFDSEAIVSLIAPRPVLFMTGDRDMGSPVSGIRKIEKIVSGAYRLYGSEGKFQSILYPDTGHEYTKDMWRKMLRWMDDELK
jgi:dienelactone hydrolase